MSFVGLLKFGDGEKHKNISVCEATVQGRRQEAVKKLNTLLSLAIGVFFVTLNKCLICKMGLNILQRDYYA